MDADRQRASGAFRVTDSPWFWGLMFSAMSLVGMAMIGPKFERRQGQIEGRFTGRQQAHMERQRRTAGLPPVDLAAEARDPSPSTSARIVPLWTLASLAAAATAGSAVMLWRQRRSHASRTRF